MSSPNREQQFSKSGWLTKQGGKRKNWKKRWFILKDGYLSYHKNAGSPALGILNLEEFALETLGHYGKLQFVFLLKNPNFKSGSENAKRGTYYISAGDYDTLDEWTKILKSALEVAKAKVSSKENQASMETIQNSSIVFGTPLELFVKKPGVASPEKGPCPLFFLDCINYLRSSALELEGLFRVAGASNKVKAAQESLNQGKPFSLDQFDTPHSVAALVKLYLRQLPEPLFPSGLYSQFMQAAAIRNPEERLERIQNLVYSLPDAHYCTSYYLFGLLSALDKSSSINLMKAQNIATVFSPTLLRPQEQTFDSIVHDTPFQNVIIITILLNFEAIFTNSWMNPTKSQISNGKMEYELKNNDILESAEPVMSTLDSDSDSDEEYDAPLPSSAPPIPETETTSTMSTTPNPKIHIELAKGNDLSPTQPKSLDQPSPSPRTTQTFQALDDLNNMLSSFRSTRGAASRTHLESLLTNLVFHVDQLTRNLKNERTQRLLLEKKIALLENQNEHQNE